MGLVETYGLGLPKTPQFKSNGKTVVPLGTGEVIVNMFVEPNFDFTAWPILLKFSNGDMILTHALAVGHGQEGAGLYYTKSTDKGKTWSPSQLAIEPNGLIVGAGLMVGHNDRIIVFSYDASAGDGRRVPYISYTDDEFQTMSEFVKVTDAYDGANRQADGTGNGVKAGGKLYKSLYGRTTSSGNRYGQLFEVTGNGTGMTFIRNLPSPESIGNFEEVQIEQLPNGMLLALLRTDSNKKTYAMHGATEKIWTQPVYAFDNWAKPAFGVSPNGSVLVMGGIDDGNGGRLPTYHWSNDMGKTWHTELISDRVKHQSYGDVQWVGSVPGVGDNLFCAVWAEDDSFPDGPCRIYREYFQEQ